MVSLRIACLGLLTLSACASSNPAVVRAPREEASVVATNLPEDGSTYGYRAEDPVRVGWGNPGVMAFFELLRGPQGQRVAWKRLGPCCDTGPTPSLEYAGLEVFEVGYEGLTDPVRLFIDPNHGAAIRAPQGFTIEGLTARETPTTPSDVIEL